MIKSTFEWEYKLHADGYGLIIGIDEVGRGPLAGPVVAAAAALKLSEGSIIEASKAQPSELWDLIRDSKTLSEKQRDKIFNFIQENFHIGIGICDHKIIDRVNILEASFLAMKGAITDLSSKLKVQNSIRRGGQSKTKNWQKECAGHSMFVSRRILLVDGNKTIPNLSMEQKAIIAGDKLVKSISAASIAAKVTRDRLMQGMHEKYPQYGFDRHMGYGTKAHLDALQKYGPCEIHRRSFTPVAKALKLAKNTY